MSRERRRFVVFGFGSTHDALDAEALLGDLGVTVTPIPTPKSVGSLCGIALRLEPADEERARRYLEGAGIAITSAGEIDDL